METLKKVLNTQNLLVWFLCEKGTIVGIQNGKVITLTEGMLCRSLPFELFRFVRCSVDAKVIYSYIDTELEQFRVFLFQLFPQTHRKKFFQATILKLSNQQQEFFRTKITQINNLEREANSSKTPQELKETFSYSCILKKMDMILDLVIDHIRVHGYNFSPKMNITLYNTFSSFMNLVEQDCDKEHFTNYYAQQMKISVRQLTDCIKNFSGKTPSQLINDVLISKIKIDLLINQKSINQLVEEYNFSDTSSLFRFFKKNTGLSPKQFQQTIK